MIINSGLGAGTQQLRLGLAYPTPKSHYQLLALFLDHVLQTPTVSALALVAVEKTTPCMTKQTPWVHQGRLWSAVDLVAGIATRTDTNEAKGFFLAESRDLTLLTGITAERFLPFNMFWWRMRRGQTPSCGRQPSHSVTRVNSAPTGQAYQAYFHCIW